MLIIRVELLSAITGQTQELARMYIANDGAGTAATGNYDGVVVRGRSKEALDQKAPQKRGRAEGYPRQRLHVWNLVARMLRNMDYR
jgi:hypothetical protein